MIEKHENIEYRYHVISEDISIQPFLDIRHIADHTKQDSWHYHNYLELGYCHYGKGEIRFEKENICFENGVFSVIPRNCVHKTIYEKGSDGRWDYFLVDVEHIVSEMYKENKVLAKEIIKSIDKKRYVLKIEEYPEIKMAMFNIRNELYKKGEFYVEAINSLLRFLIIQIVRLNDNSNIIFQDKRKSIEQIACVLDYVSENYGEEISTKQMAEMCHLSESHFRRIFKQIMDMSPTEYLYYVRVQVACEYMKKTVLSMESVAVKCGFTSISTFNRVFRKVLGISPYQWKKNLKQ